LHFRIHFKNLYRTIRQKLLCLPGRVCNEIKKIVKIFVGKYSVDVRYNTISTVSAWIYVLWTKPSVEGKVFCNCVWWILQLFVIKLNWYDIHGQKLPLSSIKCSWALSRHKQFHLQCSGAGAARNRIFFLDGVKTGAASNVSSCLSSTKKKQRMGVIFQSRSQSRSHIKMMRLRIPQHWFECSASTHKIIKYVDCRIFNLLWQFFLLMH
jgi:hypothetical protein